MMILYIFFIIILISIAIISFILIAKNQFNEYIIRINESKDSINNKIKGRIELLNKANNFIKEELFVEEKPLKKLDTIDSNNLDNDELDEKVYEVIEELYDYSEEYVELKNNIEYLNISTSIIDSESELLALKNYYNETVKKYNHLINKFPYSFYSKIKKYNEIESYELIDHSELIKNLKER